MNPLRFIRPAGFAARATLVGAALLAAAGWWMHVASAAAPTLSISQTPLQLRVPKRPQVVLALGNSESMDGTLSGAIMTGSGSLGGGGSSSLMAWTAPSPVPSASQPIVEPPSPVYYQVPAGFTPPLVAADGTGKAPYTYVNAGISYDNGPSRMNVAKGGIQAILQTYLANADFALVDYRVPGFSSQQTWVYYMSPNAQNFNFTNVQTAGSRYVANPCQNYTTASADVQLRCGQIAGSGQVNAVALANSAYMQIGASSDDPQINDVLYTGAGFPSVDMTYGGPNPPTPYPPNYLLANYVAGGVVSNYGNGVPIGGLGFTPTNAGYVSFSQQVMLARRGFGYLGSDDPTTGNLVVSMTNVGTSPTAATIAAALAPFTPFLQPETDQAWTGEIKSAALQSPLAGLLTRAKAHLDTVRPAASDCPTSQYVVLISDGLPTHDLAGGNWPPLGSAPATGYGVSATFNGDGTLGTTNDQALTDTINVLTALNAAGIKTYIIGVGAGVDPSVNPVAAQTLKAMALAGGTPDYFPANSAQALVDDMNSILVDIVTGSYATTASSVNSTHLNNNSVEYQATFNSGTAPYLDWTGDVLEHALDASGAPTGAPIWSAQTLLDSKLPGNRLIATWNPTTLTGVPFQPYNAALPLTGISSSQQSALQPTDALALQRLSYLRGDTSAEVRNGGAFRNRTHVLGDIVNSQPVFVGAPNGPYFSSSYFTFQAAKASRTPMLYVGANDGMLHAFDATTGNERFAFVPNGSFSKLYQLTAPLYNVGHQFFVDGSPQAGDVKFANNTWHTLLVGGLNGGGKSVYGIDVTDPANLTSEGLVAQAVKWEFSDSADLGFTYSQPVIASVNASPGFAVFFGNGYNSTNNHSVLYAVNPETGAQLAKLDLCTSAAGIAASACSSGAPNGLSSVTVFNSDGLLGQPMTQVYAGDLQGNLWAIDIGDATPSNWTVRLLFKAVDSSSNTQAITTAPVPTLNPNYPQRSGAIVMFGTGQFLGLPDLASTQTQTAYGVWDKPAGALPFGRTNLTSQTLTLVPPAVSLLSMPLLTATNNSINWITKAGWYADLPVAGQRIITGSGLLNGAFISTLNTPPTSTCSAPAQPMLMELNYATGGAFSTPQLDIDGSGTITPTDTYGGSNPVGIGLGNGAGSYGSSATIVKAAGGQNSGGGAGAGCAGGFLKKITLSNGTQQTVCNKNNIAARSSWSQIQ